LTAIFARVGIQGINSDFTTLVRTSVVIAALCLFLIVTGQWQKPGEISPRSWLFLMLSGLATGALHGLPFFERCRSPMWRA